MLEKADVENRQHELDVTIVTYAISHALTTGFTRANLVTHAHPTIKHTASAWISVWKVVDVAGNDLQFRKIHDLLLRHDAELNVFTGRG